MFRVSSTCISLNWTLESSKIPRPITPLLEDKRLCGLLAFLNKYKKKWHESVGFLQWWYSSDVDSQPPPKPLKLISSTFYKKGAHNTNPSRNQMDVHRSNASSIHILRRKQRSHIVESEMLGSKSAIEVSSCIDWKASSSQLSSLFSLGLIDNNEQPIWVVSNDTKQKCSYMLFIMYTLLKSQMVFFPRAIMTIDWNQQSDWARSLL